MEYIERIFTPTTLAIFGLLAFIFVTAYVDYARHLHALPAGKDSSV